MFAVTSEEDLSCSICDSLFADPRVLPCGHSFCCQCIAQWRQNSRECPLCRGPIGPVDLPRNVHLGGLVDRFSEQARQGSNCDKCGARDPQCTVCQHCRHPFCPRCVEKHVEKLRLRLQDRAAKLREDLHQLEVGLGPVMSTQAGLMRAHDALSAALLELARRSERVNAAVQARADTLHSAGQTIAELAALAGARVTADSIMRVARGIEKANQLAEKIGANGSIDRDLTEDLSSADEISQLVNRLTACLAVELSPGVTTIPGSGGPATRASLSEYYTRFPQRCTNYFTVVGSVVALSACWNTVGFSYGRGRIEAAAQLVAGAGAGALKPLPAEVLVLLEGVPPHTKVKIYSQSGAYMGSVDMRMPDGSAMTGAPSFSLAVNSANQLIAVSLPKSNAVLVTSLDGAGRQLVTRCSGIDLDNPLGVCLSDDAKVYIADYRNRRVCCVCCNTGETIRVFEDPALARVDRLAVCDAGVNGSRVVLARVEPCHLIQLTVTAGGVGGSGPVAGGSGPGLTASKIDRKFFHFYVDPFGGLVFTSGGAAESGQLKVMTQPWLPNGVDKPLLLWPDVKYSCISALRNGHIVAAAANRKEIHMF